MIVNKNFENLVKVLEEKRNTDFNIFKVLRLENYEVRHSNFLAWLLDNKASHGLGFNILEECFNKCFPNDKITFCNDVKILTEYSTDESRRIDILVIGDSFTITIENKYGSCEHGEQCQHYFKFVNEKFKDKKNNYFIFLDIEKPQDFDTDEQRYMGYHFLSYKDILEILEKQILGEEGEHLMIKHYINVLKEKYTPLDDTVKNLCENIDDIDKIIKMNNDKLPEAQKNAIETLIKYQHFIKRENDEKIKIILENMVNNKNLVRRHNNGYAYVIDVNYGFMNQIDYTAHNGLEIAFYIGLKVPNSRRLVNYISKNPDFLDNVQNLLSIENWSGNFQLSVNDGSGFHQIFCLDCNIDDTLNRNFLTNYINKHMDIVGKKDTKTIISTIEDLMKLSENKLFDKNQVDEAIEKLRNKKIGNFVWKLSLYYSLGTNSTNNKEGIAKIYKEKTLEGLNILGKDIDFKANFLKP